MSSLSHYGVMGQKWGVRRYQGTDGSWTEEGLARRRDSKYRSTDKVFVSGTSKMETGESPYYRKTLPKPIKQQLDQIIRSNAKVLVGDCVGADKMVQDYLAKNKYKNVDIYVTGDEVRNNADKDKRLGWNIHNIDGSEYEPGSTEWHAVKDIAMNKEATRGLSIILDEGAKATRKNIDRLINENKNAYIYVLGKDGVDARQSVEQYLDEKLKMQ